MVAAGATSDLYTWGCPWIRDASGRPQHPGHATVGGREMTAASSKGGPVDGVVHFEIPAEDLDRAKQFYAAAFGWESQTMPMGDGTDYTTVTTIPVDPTTMMPTQPGAINGGLVQRSEAMPAPVVTIGVISIEDALSKITSSGGSVVAARTEGVRGCLRLLQRQRREPDGTLGERRIVTMRRRS